MTDDLRTLLADCLMTHWRTPTSGCTCGGVRLGHSWPDHVADKLLAVLAEHSISGGSGARPE